jgi:hypothetical protein
MRFFLNGTGMNISSMGNLEKDYTDPANAAGIVHIYNHQYQPPSSPSWSFWHVPPVQSMQLSQITSLHCLIIYPTTSPKRKKALPRKGSSIDILFAVITQY